MIHAKITATAGVTSELRRLPLLRMRRPTGMDISADAHTLGNRRKLQIHNALLNLSANWRRQPMACLTGGFGAQPRLRLV